MVADDAFGAQLLDAYRTGRTACEIWERDDHYISAGTGFMNYFSGYDGWSVAEKEAIGLVQGSVLDIGCGAGKHALFLQGKGFEVTAIDSSPGAVTVCRSRGIRDVRLMPVADLAALGTESFNTVLFMGNTFGLLSAPQKGQRLLATLAKITAADARLIAVCQAAPSSLTDPSTPQYRQRNRQLGRRLGNVRLRCRYKTFIGGWCDFLLARPREACKVLEKSVWKVSRVVLETEPHYVIVAEKR